MARSPASPSSSGARATRAVEHLRTMGIELQMVSTRSAVHIAGSAFLTVHPLGGDPRPIVEIEGATGNSVDAMLVELDWRVRATMAARARTQLAA